MSRRSVSALRVCRLRRHGLSMRQIGGLLRRSVRDVFKIIHHHDAGSRKRYRLMEINFRTVPRYTCPQCHQEVVLSPCVVCAARRALPKRRGKK